MVKEIKIFLPRTPEAQQMLETFKAELNTIPKNERPRLVIRLLNLKDPSKYQDWLASLEELFGGVYVAEFKKYDIKSLPAVIVDGEKTIEGRYLGREEIKLLLQGLSPDLARITPIEPPVKAPPIEIQEEEQPVVQQSLLQPVQRKPQQPPISQQPPEETPPIELAPVEIEEKPIKPAKPGPTTPPPRKAGQPPQHYPTPQPPVKPPVTEQKPQPIKTPPQPQTQEQVQRTPQPPPTAAAGTCFTCIFYDQAKNRCKLLHVTVPDPTNPPCGRRKPKA